MITSAPSPREQEVLAALAQGQTTRAIAEALGVSVKTVEAHILHLRQEARPAHYSGGDRLCLRATICPEVVGL